MLSCYNNVKYSVRRLFRLPADGMFTHYVIMLPPFLFALPPLSGLFPKSPSTVPFLSNFFQKISSYTTDYQKKCAKALHPCRTFFKKNDLSLPLTIAKTPQKGHTLFPLFSKNLCLSTVDYQKKYLKRSHPFETFFQKTFIFYRGYIQNYTPLCCRFQKKIRKNLHFTTDYQDCHPILLHPFSTFLKKSIAPLSGLYPKHPPVALLLLEKIFTTPLIIKITPLFCNTLFELFSKKFYPSTVDYHFFLAFCITPNATFGKKSPLHQ